MTMFSCKYSTASRSCHMKHWVSAGATRQVGVSAALSRPAGSVTLALATCLGEIAASLDELHQRAIRTQLEQNVDIVLVLEKSLKSDEVGMTKRHVNLDLVQQLLLGLGANERRLANHFASVVSPTVETDHFVAVGEASFTKEPASVVLFDRAAFGALVASSVLSGGSPLTSLLRRMCGQ